MAPRRMLSQVLWQSCPFPEQDEQFQLLLNIAKEISTWRGNDEFAIDDILPELFDGNASDHGDVQLLESIPDRLSHGFVCFDVKVDVD